jgi:hypothetical protein
MNIQTLFAITLLALSAAASSQVVSQAYEVALSDLRAPATENGSASFKACDTCERQLVRVTSSTSYKINGRAFALKDFRAVIRNTSNPHFVAVTVLHHLESNTIKSIDVSL